MTSLNEDCISFRSPVRLTYLVDLILLKSEPCRLVEVWGYNNSQLVVIYLVTHDCFYNILHVCNWNRKIIADMAEDWVYANAIKIYV
jgi:hypothetical protein